MSAPFPAQTIGLAVVLLFERCLPLLFGSRRGAFAEYVCAPEDKLALMPAHVSYDEAAAVPVAPVAGPVAAAGQDNDERAV